MSAPYTNQSPVNALKAAFLHFIENGSEASEMDPPFPSDDADEPWTFMDESASDEIAPPAWTVAQQDDTEPIVETSPAGQVVPIRITLYAPHGASKEWIQACIDEMWNLLTAQYHAREEPSPADRTPLAWRLNSAAEEMEDPQPLFVHHTTVPVFHGISTAGEAITAEFELDVVCGMLEEES